MDDDILVIKRIAFFGSTLFGKRLAIPATKASCDFDDVGREAVPVISEEAAAGTKRTLGVVTHTRNG